MKLEYDATVDALCIKLAGRSGKVARTAVSVGIGTRWGPYVSERLTALLRDEGRGEWEGEWPSPVAVLSARDVAGQCMPTGAPTPSVVPAEDGNVVLVWHKGGWDIEVKVDRESYAGVWARKTDGRRFAGPLDEHRDELGTLLSELGAA